MTGTDDTRFLVGCFFAFAGFAAGLVVLDLTDPRPPFFAFSCLAGACFGELF